jgi:hypothetical protein
MASKHAMILVVVVVCGLTVLAAPPADAESGRDACALVTQAQVTSAAGATFGAGQPIGTTGCQWSTDPKAKAGRVTVTLSIWEEKFFPKKSTPGITIKPVSGIGDDAVSSTLGDLASLFVKKGKSTLMLRVYGLHDTAKQEQIERSVAEAALARW